MIPALNTREGWAAFVAENIDPPIPVTRAELEMMSPGDRAMNREARKLFMIRGPVVNTTQFAGIERELRRRLMLNQYKSNGKLGVMVSGEPTPARPPPSPISPAGSSGADATWAAHPRTPTRSR